MNVNTIMKTHGKKQTDIIELQEKKEKKRKEELLKVFKLKNQELQKQYINNTSKTQHLTKEKESTDKDKKIKKLLSKQKKLNSKIENLKTLNNTIKIQEKKLKDKNFKLQQNIIELKREIKKQKNLISTMKNESKDLEKENKKLLLQTQNQDINKLSQTNKLLQDRNVKQAQEIQNLSNLINKLNLQLLNFESLGKLNGKINLKNKYKKNKSKNKTPTNKNQINRQNYKLKLINKNLKDVNEYLTGQISISKILSFIEYYLSFNCPYNILPENTQSSKIIKIDDSNESIVQINKEINDNLKDLSSKAKYKINKPNCLTVHKVVNNLNSNKNIQYGYVSHENDIYYFNSLNGEKYIIIYVIPIYNLDVPCKAVIKEDNVAQIIQVYDDQDNLNFINIKNKRKQPKISTKRNELTNFYKKDFKDKTVLIIGCNYKNIYISVLTQCGLNVLWHNPFEEHPITLGNKISHADSIILCADHISHTMLDWADFNDKRFQLIYNDTIERILSRIKFTLVNTGKG